MTIDEVKSFLTENANDEAVKGFVSELKKPTFEAVSNWIETDEGKKLMGPIFDRRVSKSIESWKENHGAKTSDELKELIAQKEEELRKKYAPELTPEQKEIQEIKEKLAQSEREKVQSQIQANVISLLTDQGLPKELSGFVQASNVDEIPSKIEALKGVIDSVVNKTIETKLKTSSIRPEDSNVKSSGNSVEQMEIELNKLVALNSRSADVGAQIMALKRQIHEAKLKQ